MKRLKSILVLAGISVLFSCLSNVSYPEAMQKAIRCMEQNADSASDRRQMANQSSLLTISLAVIRPISFRQWAVIDISLSLITAYDMLSCLYADFSVPAIYSALFPSSA